MTQMFPVLSIVLTLACGAQALDTPQLSLGAVSDGVNTQVQLSWTPVEGASYYQVRGRTTYAGTDSLLTTTTATNWELTLPTGWDWQSQVSVLGFYSVTAISHDPESLMVMIPA
ncbi:MAG: hypothetical protein KDC10_13600, partial [Calditrichaeota bacterium]|nr:hypothetical protein [Calditrichota bacterium]